MGGAESRASVCGCEELSGDGSAGGVVDGEVERYWGFVGCAEGSGGDEAWGVFGVDWYVFVFHCSLNDMRRDGCKY